MATIHRRRSVLALPYPTDDIFVLPQKFLSHGYHRYHRDLSQTL